MSVKPATLPTLFAKTIQRWALETKTWKRSRRKKWQQEPLQDTEHVASTLRKSQGDPKIDLKKITLICLIVFVFHFDPQHFPAKHHPGVCSVCQTLTSWILYLCQHFRVDSFLTHEVTPTRIETELLCSISTQKVKQTAHWSRVSSPEWTAVVNLLWYAFSFKNDWLR